ncbi:Glycogenin-1-like protein 2 [Phlyctema vagabunda]|uniref:Glycogenin-1-like protein 2 n=1 Tax=Phlyctema vagabunda TaxID=108571 RepID=A0ABR4PQ37_9HELO
MNTYTPFQTNNSSKYRKRTYNVAAAVAAFLGLLYILQFVQTSTFSIRSSISMQRVPPHQYAYCTFLAPYAKGTGQAIGAELSEEDHYLVGARMLIYQLLHDPITRTTSNIPFIVLVTTDVPQSDRHILEQDGATVIEVEPVNIDWIKPGRERWAHVMDKLHVFELTQFEKILLLDTDVVVVKPLDAIFQDPATQISTNLEMANKIRDDEAPQPYEYMMAGNSGPYTAEHPYPAPRGDRLNAGFVILKPSVDMFNHYISVASIEGRFPGGSPEQDLWNYVHHRDGNMPWKQIDPDWTANTPIYNDYKNGIATFHEKYWGCSRDKSLRDVLLRSRWKMEGFWDART